MKFLSFVLVWFFSFSAFAFRFRECSNFNGSIRLIEHPINTQVPGSEIQSAIISGHTYGGIYNGYRIEERWLTPNQTVTERDGIEYIYYSIFMEFHSPSLQGELLGSDWMTCKAATHGR
jgi:hypothetical protein